jgi:hypothetical protein
LVFRERGILLFPGTNIGNLAKETAISPMVDQLHYPHK